MCICHNDIKTGKKGMKRPHWDLCFFGQQEDKYTSLSDRCFKAAIKGWFTISPFLLMCYLLVVFESFIETSTVGFLYKKGCVALTLRFYLIFGKLVVLLNYTVPCSKTRLTFPHLLYWSNPGWIWFRSVILWDTFTLSMGLLRRTLFWCNTVYVPG